MSSCEMPGTEKGRIDARVSDKGSRVHRFIPAMAPAESNAWHGVAVEDYKAPAAHHCGVERSVLAGADGDATRFQVRYFEISPNGFSSREHHRHEHVVVVMRGTGEVCLGGTWHEVGFGDTVYVAPLEVHQLRNRGAEPFGFLCVVDAERDSPVSVEVRACEELGEPRA